MVLFSMGNTVCATRVSQAVGYQTNIVRQDMI
jgi:hypothetical protein